MRKRKTFFIWILLFVIILKVPGTVVLADFKEDLFYDDGFWQYIDPDTGYMAVLWDDADLLTNEEEELLINDMIPITAYGHVVFSSDYQEDLDTDHWAEEVLRLVCDEGESGVVFETDMTNRQIYIFSDGDINKIVTSSYAYTITDNVYTYAVDGKYYECASKAYGQILSLLDGQGISQPMKHINNILLAIALGILLNFMVLNMLKKKNNKNIAREAIRFDGEIKNLNVVPGPLKRVYNPKTKSGGGGGGRSGGGGGRSGGGGGHSF